MKRGGSVMGAKLRADVGEDPEYTRCALQGIHMDLIGPCGGRVTREHAMIYGGKKIQEKWAIPPICAAHHGVDLYQDAPTEAKKEIRVWVALNRASDEDLARFSKAMPSYFFQRDRLNTKYGPYVAPPIPERSLFSIASQPVPVKKAPVRRLTQEELFEREVKAYARTNGVPVDEARAFLIEFV